MPEQALDGRLLGLRMVVKINVLNYIVLIWHYSANFNVLWVF